MNYFFYDTCALLEAQQTIFENKEGEDYIQLIVSNNQTNLDTVLKIVDKINNEYN